MKYQQEIDGVDAELVGENILKFTLHENATYEQKHIDQLAQFIKKYFDNVRVAYLIDALNKYDSSFKAMTGFTAYENLVAVAFIVYENEMRDRVRYLNILPMRENKQVKMESFDSEPDAIAWLEKMLSI